MTQIFILRNMYKNLDKYSVTTCLIDVLELKSEGFRHLFYDYLEYFMEYNLFFFFLFAFVQFDQSPISV